MITDKQLAHIRLRYGHIPTPLKISDDFYYMPNQMDFEDPIEYHSYACKHFTDKTCRLDFYIDFGFDINSLELVFKVISDCMGTYREILYVIEDE